MGRLFWKFFFFIWLAQLTTVLGTSAVFWWKHQQEEARWQAAGVQPDQEARPRHTPPPHRHRPPVPVEPLAAGFLASLVFAALLARHFSTPIRKLRSAFDAAAGGDLDVRVGSAMGQRRDELTELGQEFDRMATQLQALVDGQRRLLHDVSHELRSPLARLQAAIDLARQQPAKLEASMERVEKESVRIDRLLGELLTLSRLEAGMAGRPSEEVEVGELLAGIVADARFEAGARDVAVELEEDGDAVVDGDGELLHRAIENVVRNAVRFSPPGGEVRVSTRMDAAVGELRVVVDDRGPGVPEADLEAIFLPFYRGSRAKDNDGHGLGLALAKRVVESAGGRIGGANRAEGGFRMEIALPAKSVLNSA